MRELSFINFNNFKYYFDFSAFCIILYTLGEKAKIYHILQVLQVIINENSYCLCALSVLELKREIAIWERTARLMPVVSLEERAIRDALRTKAAEVREQLKEAKNMT